MPVTLLKEPYTVPATGTYQGHWTASGWTLVPWDLTTALLGVSKSIERLNLALGAL